MRGMEGRVSYKKRSSRKIRKNKKAHNILQNEHNMQCAAEQKYCAGVLGRLRDRAAAQLRGNVAGTSLTELDK